MTTPSPNLSAAVAAAETIATSAAVTAAEDIRTNLGRELSDLWDREAPMNGAVIACIQSAITSANAELVAEVVRLKEELAVAQSQVENADVNLEQVRVALNSRHKAERDPLLQRAEQAEKERDRAMLRVHSAETSSDCPFCETYPATGHAQQVPMCRLCQLESERDTALSGLSSAKADADALREEVAAIHYFAARPNADKVALLCQMHSIASACEKMIPELRKLNPDALLSTPHPGDGRTTRVEELCEGLRDAYHEGYLDGHMEGATDATQPEKSREELRSIRNDRWDVSNAKKALKP